MAERVHGVTPGTSDPGFTASTRTPNPRRISRRGFAFVVAFTSPESPAICLATSAHQAPLRNPQTPCPVLLSQPQAGRGNFPIKHHSPRVRFEAFAWARHRETERSPYGG